MKPRSSITTWCIFALALLLVANVVWFHTPLVGVPAFFFLLTITGARASACFFPAFGRVVRNVLGILLALAWIMVLGSIFYYVAVLNTITVSIIILSLPIVTRWRWGITNEVAATPQDPQPTKQRFIAKLFLCIVFAVCICFAFRILLRVDVYDSIRSPWEVLPSHFFLLIFLAAAALVTLALTKSRIAIALAIPFFFLFFSVTALTYPLGYGFDPFIHQTTENYISEHGTITPKPFTYIGQYALVVTAHRATALPIPAIDRWLLPVLLAIFLPIAGWVAFREPLAAVLLPILPMSTFAVTTPQAIGNAFVLITVLLALGFGRDRKHQEIKRSRITLWLLGLATALTHPIAGIPLLVFIFLWSLRKPKNEPPLPSPAPDFKPMQSIPSWFDPIRPVLTGLAIITGAVALPILFILYGFASSGSSGIRPDTLARIPLVLTNLGSSLVAFQSRFNFLLDFVYLYHLNLAFVLIAGSLITLALFWKKSRWLLLLPVTALLVLVNGVLLDATIDFSFLPFYEQSGYTQRLFDIAKLFLLPIFLIGLALGIRAVIKKHGFVVRIGTIALCAGLLTTSLYLMYPHPDAYTVERGFNVGAADFEAVQSIEQDAAGKPYIVLANQAVSAAALKEFGFKQYFDFRTEDGPVTSFFYPIPTGGPLYNYYLQMVYDAPRAATIREAMDRAGIELGYLVVNRYWYQSEKIIEQAKGQTNDWWQFENGTTHVFKFQMQ